MFVKSALSFLYTSVGEQLYFTEVNSVFNVSAHFNCNIQVQKEQSVALYCTVLVANEMWVSKYCQCCCFCCDSSLKIFDHPLYTT